MAQAYPYPPRRRRRRVWYYLFGLLRSVLCIGAAGVLVVVLFSQLDRNASTCVADFTTPDEDAAPPIITGVKDVTLYEGDTLFYRDGVSVVDDLDESPVLTIDSSAVDTTKPGTYTVIYTARDASGNTSEAAATVQVLAWNGGFVPMDTIWKTVDVQLQSILSEDMNTRQQVEAIYNWARTSLSYANHSDKSDPYQAGYNMLLTYSGDCFSYYAATKLMLDRLEIPNLDVRKVKREPEDSDHYWSLVSVDGGKTYYHFDATPRYGDDDQFCLITDAALNAYSEAHNHSHNRDQSLYPATPEV